MRKLTFFMLLIISSVFFTTLSTAGVRFITDLGDGDFFGASANFTCPETFITCESPKQGIGPTCNGKYQTCKCPVNFVSCSSPYAGVGAECEGKYDSCQCEAQYSLSCAAPSTGIGISCNGKFSECGCPISWDDSCSSPKESLGQTCQKRSANSEGHVTTNSTVYHENCQCPSEYLWCEKGGAAGATSCKNTDETFVRYSECYVLTCTLPEWKANDECVSPPAEYARTCQDLIDITNSSYTGDILVWGSLDCGENTIGLKAGQHLVGQGYFPSLYPADTDVNKASRINWNFTTTSKDALTVPANGKISHLTLNVNTTQGAATPNAIISAGTGLKLDNIHLNLTAKMPSTTKYAAVKLTDKTAILDIGENVYLKMHNSSPTNTPLYGFYNATVNIKNGVNPKIHANGTVSDSQIYIFNTLGSLNIEDASLEALFNGYLLSSVATNITNSTVNLKHHTTNANPYSDIKSYAFYVGSQPLIVNNSVLNMYNLGGMLSVSGSATNTGSINNSTVNSTASGDWRNNQGTSLNTRKLPFNNSVMNVNMATGSKYNGWYYLGPMTDSQLYINAPNWRHQISGHSDLTRSKMVIKVGPTGGSAGMASFSGRTVLNADSELYISQDGAKQNIFYGYNDSYLSLKDATSRAYLKTNNATSDIFFDEENNLDARVILEAVPGAQMFAQAISPIAEPISGLYSFQTTCSRTPASLDVLYAEATSGSLDFSRAAPGSSPYIAALAKLDAEMAALDARFVGFMDGFDVEPIPDINTP